MLMTQVNQYEMKEKWSPKASGWSISKQMSFITGDLPPATTC